MQKQPITYSTPLSANEVRIIETIRSLHPFERVIITGDKEGKIDNYLVERSWKIVLTTLDML